MGTAHSGGAVALASGNHVLMFENAIYSVISPEGCASILWRSAEHAKDAAEALRLTAADLLKLGVVDEIIAEPLGGAHRDPAAALKGLGEAIEAALQPYLQQTGDALKARRRAKFIAIGDKRL